MLHVHRDELLTSSFDRIMSIPSGAVLSDRACVCVAFVGEDAVGEGVARDWVTAVFDALFDPNLGIFVSGGTSGGPNHRTMHPAAFGPKLYPPRHQSLHHHDASPSFSEWMEFTGRMISLAARMRIPMGYYLSDALICMVSCRPLGLAQLEDLDPMVHASCERVLRAGEAELQSMMLPGFVAPNLLGDLRGPDEASEVELIVGASDVEIETANAPLLVELMTNHYCGRWGAAHDAACAIRRGMRVMSAQVSCRDLVMLLSLMTSESINALLGGALDITMQDLSDVVCVLVQPDVPSADAESVQHSFWQMVNDMSAETRRALVRFWTGSHCLPRVSQGVWNSGGTGRSQMLQLSIRRSDRPLLPWAHTCYRQLVLPVPYSTGQPAAHAQPTDASTAAHAVQARPSARTRTTAIQARPTMCMSVAEMTRCFGIALMHDSGQLHD